MSKSVFAVRAKMTIKVIAERFVDSPFQGVEAGSALHEELLGCVGCLDLAEPSGEPTIFHMVHSMLEDFDFVDEKDISAVVEEVRASLMRAVEDKLDKVEADIEETKERFAVLAGVPEEALIEELKRRGLHVEVGQWSSDEAPA